MTTILGIHLSLLGVIHLILLGVGAILLEVQSSNTRAPGDRDMRNITNPTQSPSFYIWLSTKISFCGGSGIVSIDNLKDSIVDMSGWDLSILWGLHFQ